MSSAKSIGGQAWIKAQVLGQDLCTGCGACVGLCPYQQFHHDRTAVIHDCDREEGRCSAYCPRSPADLNGLKAALFDPADLTPELGAVKGLFTTRAADLDLRARAQHGGTVSALVRLALEHEIIESVVLAGGGEDLLSRGEVVGDRARVTELAGSRFVVSPTVAAFNLASTQGSGPIGVVATPCQALALAKMRVRPWAGDEQRVARLALVIGLFCGWALDWRRLRALLANKVPGARILGMDIPPGKHACMEIYTQEGVIEIPIAEVQACVRESCNACFDMTCELADLSVGGARSPEGWEMDKGWNQVLLRSAAGQDLMDLARTEGTLEFRETPEGNLERLKAAALKKKRTCLANLEALGGSPGNLIYLSEEDVLCRQ